eukprot:gb/GECG01003268.1/.p1 GENE.gb/GECG01003268.1/~~gb/GECG01003268.1/.p1  ORF type:complete len:871 (+),score=132.66 gb/GECG01003268.1/:1-2613(+)
MEEWMMYNSPLRRGRSHQEHGQGRTSSLRQPQSTPERHVHMSPEKYVDKAMQGISSKPKPKKPSPGTSGRQMLYPLRYRNEISDDDIRQQRDPLLSKTNMLELSSPPPPPPLGSEALESEEEEVEALNREIMACNQMYREGKETLDKMQMMDEKKARQIEDTNRTVKELKELYNSLYTSLKDAATEIQRSTEGTLQARSPVRKVADSVTSRLPENPQMIAETTSGIRLTSSASTTERNASDKIHEMKDAQLSEEDDETQYKQIKSKQAEISTELSHSIEDLLQEAREMIIRRQNQQLTSAQDSATETVRGFTVLTTAKTTMQTAAPSSRPADTGNTISSTSSEPFTRSTSTHKTESEDKSDRETTSRKGYRRASSPSGLPSATILDRKDVSSTTQESAAQQMYSTVQTSLSSEITTGSEHTCSVLSSTSASFSSSTSPSPLTTETMKDVDSNKRKSRANRIRRNKSGTPPPPNPPPKGLANNNGEAASKTSDKSGDITQDMQQASNRSPSEGRAQEMQQAAAYRSRSEDTTQVVQQAAPHRSRNDDTAQEMQQAAPHRSRSEETTQGMQQAASQRSRSNSLDSLSKESSLLQQGIQSISIHKYQGKERRKSASNFSINSVYYVKKSPSPADLSIAASVLSHGVAPLVVSSKVNAIEQQSPSKRRSKTLTTDHRASQGNDSSRRLPHLSVDSAQIVEIPPLHDLSELRRRHRLYQSQQLTATTVSRCGVRPSQGEYYWKAASSGNPSSLILMRNDMWQRKRSPKRTEASTFTESPKKRRPSSRSTSPAQWRGYPHSRSKSKTKEQQRMKRTDSQSNGISRANNSSSTPHDKSSKTESPQRAVSPLRFAQRQWLERRIRNTENTPVKDVQSK